MAPEALHQMFSVICLFTFNCVAIAFPKDPTDGEDRAPLKQLLSYLLYSTNHDELGIVPLKTTWMRSTYVEGGG